MVSSGSAVAEPYRPPERNIAGLERDNFMKILPGSAGADASAVLCRVALAALMSLAVATSAWAQAGPPQVTVAPPLASRVAQWDEFTGRFEATERVEVRPR